jgi:hypothetical protein
MDRMFRSSRAAKGAFRGYHPYPHLTAFVIALQFTQKFSGFGITRAITDEGIVITCIFENSKRTAPLYEPSPSSQGKIQQPRKLKER